MWFVKANLKAVVEEVANNWHNGKVPGEMLPTINACLLQHSAFCGQGAVERSGPASLFGQGKGAEHFFG